MQWIFLLTGLVLGGVFDESFNGVIIGALFGLGVAQAIRLSTLSRQGREQHAALAELHKRLALLEAAGPAMTETETAQPAIPASPAPVTTSPTTEPELTWDWPAPAAPVPTPVKPAPFDAWRAAPATLAGPGEPSFMALAWSRARDWLLGGNTVLRVGVLLLFLGLAFLLRYATENIIVPLELRYAGVAASGLVLLGLGWWLRGRNRGYALILQGAGVAVLYLTVFAAMRLQTLLEPGAAMALLVMVTVFSAILALQQDALALAAAAALGGFAAPILTATDAGNPVALFSYFALLNAGILAIAWFKAWRLLNLIGFVGTFGTGFAWGLRAYTPELFWSTEPFLLLFFLMYLAIGLLFARRTLLEQAQGGDWLRRPGSYVDGSILFGPPLVGFALQFAVIRHLDLGPALSALGLGAIYLVVARGLAKKASGRAQLLVETCLALGVVFASLAIPLGLDARWTTAAWAVEGAGIYWLGIRQQRLSSRCFALLLQAGSALIFLDELRWGGVTLLQGMPLGALLLGGALLFSFYQLLTAAAAQIRPWERWALPWLACFGLGFVYLLAPLCFDYQGTTLVWAVAGLLTVVAGLRLQSRSFLVCAVAIQLLAGALFLLAGTHLFSDLPSEGLQPLAHGDFWAPLVLGVAGMIGAWRMSLDRTVELTTVRLSQLSAASLLWGAAWWALAWASDVLRFVPVELQATTLLFVDALSVALWAWLAQRLRWSSLATLCTLLMPAALLVLIGAWGLDYHPAAHFGALAWLSVFAVHYLMLRRLPGQILPKAASAAHVLGCWMVIGVLSLELRYGLLLLSEHYNAWRWLGWAVLPSLYLVLMASPRALPWPVAAYPREYRWLAALPLAVTMLAWFWLANIISDGTAEPLPYLPLFNPLELGLLFALFGVHVWSRGALATVVRFARRVTQGVIGLSLFGFFTALVMRTAYHWGGVAYKLDELLASMRVQAGLSIVWTLIALGLMISGHLGRRREVWLIGASLIVLVVAKLFFVELSNHGGLARIVSFIGVGVLLLVVGYFAPLPPRQIESQVSEADEGPTNEQ